ncbi:MAG: hypothetical protein AAFV62_12840, partial [Pseudomonadota bacterium]
MSSDPREVPTPSRAAVAELDPLPGQSLGERPDRLNDSARPDGSSEPKKRRNRRRKNNRGRPRSQGGAAQKGSGQGGEQTALTAKPAASAAMTTGESADGGAAGSSLAAGAQGCPSSSRPASEEPRPEHAAGRANRPVPARGGSERKADPKRRSWRSGPAIAALDLGTNNCRLLIARPDREGFNVIDAFSRVVRLGEGLNDQSRLSEDAMKRTIDALSVCADRLKRHRVQRFRAIATEACRRAGNQREFIDRIWRETGLSIDVIAPEEEARLAVAGCAPLLEPTSEHLLVFDIGGGSTELIWIDLSKATPKRRRRLLMALALGAERSDRARAAASQSAGPGGADLLSQPSISAPTIVV